MRYDGMNVWFGVINCKRRYILSCMPYMNLMGCQFKLERLYEWKFTLIFDSRGVGKEKNLRTANKKSKHMCHVTQIVSFILLILNVFYLTFISMHVFLSFNMFVSCMKVFNAARTTIFLRLQTHDEWGVTLNCFHLVSELHL